MNVSGAIRRQRTNKRDRTECGASWLGLTPTKTQFPQVHRSLSLPNPDNRRLTDCMYCR